MTSDESTNFWVDAPYNDRIPSLSPYRQYSTVRLSFPRPDEFSRLVAEGDAVFARFNYTITLPDGSTTTARALAYCRLADGRIAVNDVMFDPDPMKVLGPLMAPPPGAV